MPLPPEVIAMLEQKARAGWSGKVTLNLKDGHVLDYEVTEKTRVVAQRSAA